MDGSAVKAIAELEDENKIIEIGDQKFSRKSFSLVYHDPRPEPLVGSSLKGLLDYIRENRDTLEYSMLMVQVVNFSEVRLLSSPSGPSKNRTTHFIAKLDKELPTFPFDSYLEQEEFVIKINALFDITEDRAKVVMLASKVAAQDKITGEDDGLAQNVSITKGVSGAATGEVTTRGWYVLKPYRTFRDLEQPESAFILRLRENNGKVPRIALFDAQGEIWRHDAIEAIKNFLIAGLVDDEGNGIDIPVIA